MFRVRRAGEKGQRWACCGSFDLIHTHISLVVLGNIFTYAASIPLLTSSGLGQHLTVDRVGTVPMS